MLMVPGAGAGDGDGVYGMGYGSMWYKCVCLYYTIILLYNTNYIILII